jgi:DNA-binding response OmpR family regulator
MLTALGTTEDKLSGFDAGADDYLVKPFEFQELIARLRALQKRGKISNPEQDILKIADLELNLTTKTVKRSNKKIELTVREMALLEFFLRNQGRALNRIEIAAKVWDVSFDTGTNVVDVYINYLRKKIDKNFSNKLIHTITGIGYIMKEGDD